MGKITITRRHDTAEFGVNNDDIIKVNFDFDEMSYNISLKTLHEILKKQFFVKSLDGKFINNDFDAIYKIAMHMADTVIVKNHVADRFNKLAEEYKELTESFETYTASGDENSKELMIKELSDVLFVLMHIASHFNITPLAILHYASSKMHNRLVDVNYKPKN